MIITIDGPAGSGKSTAARELAGRLGFHFLDTGAMYRVVTWVCLREGIDLHNTTAVIECTRRIQARFEGRRVWVEDHEITNEIRTTVVTQGTRYVAPIPEVREILNGWQRVVATGINVVTEGRDQGTVVFPHAECKFFLTATPEERARRRHQELAERDEHVSVEEILRQQTDRDRRDEQREVAPLKPASDAMMIDTTGQSIEVVVATLEAIVRDRMKHTMQ